MKLATLAYPLTGLLLGVLFALTACSIDPGTIDLQTDQLPADTTLEAARTHAFGWSVQ